MLLLQVAGIFALPFVFSFMVIFGRFIELPKKTEEKEEMFNVPKVEDLNKITARLLKQPRRLNFNPAYTMAGYIPR